MKFYPLFLLNNHMTHQIILVMDGCQAYMYCILSFHVQGSYFLMWIHLIFANNKIIDEFFN